MRCIICNFQFDPKTRGFVAKTCSLTCQKIKRQKSDSNRRQIRQQKRIEALRCLECGEKPKKWRRVFCSAACSKKHHHARRLKLQREHYRKHPKTFECVICSKVFNRKNTAVTCSIECRESRKREWSANKNLRLHPLKNLTCKICGARFSSGKSHLKTCSIKCRTAWNKKRRSEWRRRPDNKELERKRKAELFRRDAKYRDRHYSRNIAYGFGFTLSNCPPELIAVRREYLKLKRFIREITK